MTCMTEDRLRGPQSFKRRSIESLPDDSVPFDVVDWLWSAGRMGY